jgi:hypothetical protein
LQGGHGLGADGLGEFLDADGGGFKMYGTGILKDADKVVSHDLMYSVGMNHAFDSPMLSASARMAWSSNHGSSM